jgi:restriction endonuclease S subunit
MSKWPTSTLGNVAIAKSGNGKIIKGSLPTANDDGRLFPAYSATGQDVFSEEYDHEGDGIVVSAVGARCGKCFMATGRWRAIANTHVLLPRKDKVRARFLWYLVNDEHFWIKGGTAQPFVKIGDSLNKVVPLPPLTEQDWIVQTLDEADAIRSLRAQADARAALLLPSIYHMEFGDPLTNPRGWPLRRLVDICSPRQWPTISQTDLTEVGYPVFGANGRIGYYHSYNHEKPTVLIGCRGTCGNIVVSEPQSYVTGNAMSLDEPDESAVNLVFLEWTLRIRGLKDTITGAAQPQITRKNLERVFVPTPSLDHQRTFAIRVAETSEIHAAQVASRARLDHLFQSLLYRAIQGES